MALITDLDDRTLVEQHRAGNPDAFRRIVERHHRSLYANALRRLRDPVLAEDAVQETFLRAFRNLGRFEGDYRLDAWLHRIVTNACHDIGRRRGRDVRLFDRACTTVEVESPPADDDIEVLEAPEIDRILDQLPASYREVLVLRFVDEMSYSDVAEKAGISEENARARVSRGRNMLKRMMTSASALVVWAIPPLRRAQVQVGDAEAASQAAQQVQHLTGLTSAVSTVAPSGGLSHLSTLVAQSGPVIASATPSVVSAGPGVKAAVAAGLAAAVAIPTGVAVDRVRDKPEPQVAAPLADEGSQEDLDAPVAAAAPKAIARSTESSDAKTEVSTLSTGGATPSDVLAAPSTTIAAPIVDATTTTLAPAVPEQSSDAPADQGPGSTPPTTSPSPSDEPPPPPPAPAPSGTMTAGSLQLTEAGWRLDMAGATTLVIGEESLTGELDGRIGVGKADPKDPQAPREVDGWVTLTLADGSFVKVDFVGTAVVTEQGQTDRHDLTVRFRLEGDADVDLATSGELAGTFVTNGSDGSLTLTIPGRTS